MARRRRPARRLLTVSLAILAVILGGVAAAAYGSYRWAPLGPPGHTGPNAVWAAHHWVGQSQVPADYDGLVAQLDRNAITDIFFHVGPLTGAGAIPPQLYPNAADLVREVKQRNPALRLQAWIGQVEKQGGGPLDLSDPQTRAAIVATAETFLDLGFDGIHYNIEPVRSGNAHLLALLDDTKVLTDSRGKILSMAADEMSLFPGADALAGMMSPRASLWSPAYYQQVADRVDQVAVMMYDTMSPTDWIFATLVAWETNRLLSVVDRDTTLFMGVPTYEERRPGFRPEAENMVSGLRGVTLGLRTAGEAAARPFGVAVYAHWTTDPDEWRTFRRDWLGR